MTSSAFFLDLSQGGKLEGITGTTVLLRFIGESKQILQSASAQRVLAYYVFDVAPIFAQSWIVVPREFLGSPSFFPFRLEINVLYAYIAKRQ